MQLIHWKILNAKGGVNINRLNLIGERFGRLVVVDKADDYIRPNGSHLSQWVCNCDCGTKNKIIIGSSLKNGSTQSCGCIHKEKTSQISKALKKYNKYDLESFDYGIGYTDDGNEFYFDLEDFDKIKDYYWRHDKRNYIKTKIKQKTVFMHRLILDVDDKNICVDHIHGENTHNDNRRSNLRIATHSQNSMNKKIIKTNTSGCTGVYYNKKNNNWRAKITVNKKYIELGSYNNIEDAIKARKDAEEKYFGEWSYEYSQSI